MSEHSIENSNASDQAQIRGQVELLAADRALSKSKRCLSFLRYIVDETLAGRSAEIKERSIGIAVFDRVPDYDTSLDHVVRTTATELRKRLAFYYSGPTHSRELQISLPAGSYVPMFSAATCIPTEIQSCSLPVETLHKPEGRTAGLRSWRAISILIGAFVLCCVSILLIVFNPFAKSSENTGQNLFWKPLLQAQGPVYILIGAAALSAPSSDSMATLDNSVTIERSSSLDASVPLADAITMSRIQDYFALHGKQTIIRSANQVSFADLRDGPVVLVGAFNNDWSLRLSAMRRFSLAVDSQRRLVYIKDAQRPERRDWQVPLDWCTGSHPKPCPHVHQDFALISRVADPTTGNIIVIIGGIACFGTAAASEFLSDPELTKALDAARIPPSTAKTIQIVLGTKVVDDHPGKPYLIAIDVGR